MTREYERFAGACAIVVGGLGLLYSIAFVIFVQTDEQWADTLSEACLTAGGLLSVAVFVAVYDRLRAIDAAFALLAFVLGLVGALGASIHGAFELGKIANPPKRGTDIPHPVDPRGFLTFAVAALALLVVAWLIARGAPFPRRLGHLAVASALLLLIVYFGRLIVLDPKEPFLLAAAVLVGLIVNPALYAWLGLVFLRARPRS